MEQNKTWRAIHVDLADLGWTFVVLGADILVVFIIFFDKKCWNYENNGRFFIVYMFVHGFQVKEKFFLSFFRKHFFQIFQENFEIQAGHHRLVTWPLNKNFKICFSFFT
jgi:benzoyl-CoA reductase/2-hydroxyglutaryl-CoA dehydratase subunit BcrC/BadD/HgdB